MQKGSLGFLKAALYKSLFYFLEKKKLFKYYESQTFKYGGSMADH